MAYTALARLAALARRPDEAHAFARQLMESPSLPTRLRTFVPALQAFSAAGDVDKAFQARRAPSRVHQLSSRGVCVSNACL